MTKTRYPKVENADELLKKACLERMEVYDNNTEKAIERLNEELETIKRQRSASGYLMVGDLLKHVNAVPEEYCFFSSIASTVVSYLLGFTVTDPLRTRINLYPEFFFGIRGENNPSFYLRVNDSLYDRLINYYNSYPDKSKICIKEFGTTDKEVYLYFKSSPENDQVELDNIDPKEEFCFYFHLGFRRKYLKTFEDLYKNRHQRAILKIMNPYTTSDLIRCICLFYSSTGWKNNSQLLLNKGVNSREIITCREDVYEKLIRFKIDKDLAFRIAENVRKGLICAKGWNINTLELLKQHNIPGWFIESCEKITYLTSRAWVVDEFAKRCR